MIYLFEHILFIFNIYLSYLFVHFFIIFLSTPLRPQFENPLHKSVNKFLNVFSFSCMLVTHNFNVADNLFSNINKQCSSFD